MAELRVTENNELQPRDRQICIDRDFGLLYRPEHEWDDIHLHPRIWKSHFCIFGGFAPSVPSPSYVNGVQVPVCDNAMHLGNLVSNNISDCVDHGMGKFNFFMSSFGKCQSSVKNKLFMQYCFSFYGSQIWPVYKNELMKKIIVNWRNALRRIWTLECTTKHSLWYLAFISFSKSHRYTIEM